MISKQMIDWGESGCSIREIAAYGERRAAEIGPENVYNFAIGNPSIDPPDCVHAAVERLLRTVPPTQLHAYAPAPGMASVREKVAAYLTDTFGEAYRAQDIYMTDGASSALAILTRALMGPGMRPSCSRRISRSTPSMPRRRAAACASCRAGRTRLRSISRRLRPP